MSSFSVSLSFDFKIENLWETLFRARIYFEKDTRQHRSVSRLAYDKFLYTVNMIFVSLLFGQQKELPLEGLTFLILTPA